ncbi:hypothetical protein TNCV_1464241 [Trichonephila clavipes]|nr:hypothetical protein TNCV_1464241 [Trichonephila clavipes]
MKVDVAKAFEIPLSSLSTILKNKEKFFSASSSRVRKRVSKGLDEDEWAFWSASANQALFLRMSIWKEKKTTVAARGCEKNAPTCGRKQEWRVTLKRGDGRAGTGTTS